MSGDLLQTKLNAPRLRPALVPRPRLIDQLNQGLTGKLTLISAPAGFGKTTLVTSWLDTLQTGSAPPPSTSPPPTATQIAWLSLDENDSAPARFLSYLIAALQSVDPRIGESARPLLQASPLPMPTVLTALLNDIAVHPDPMVLVLDDYHVIDAHAIDEALAFLLDHVPPQLHLVITTREDPNLPLARLRVRGLLTELRSADLRFSVAETAVFLQQTMGLDLTAEQIAALETRTEGWVAGLQMAALSMRGQSDVASFIQSFTGSHRFVLDYLLEEVLHQQPAHVQAFLLQTAVVNQLTGSLCNALTGESDGQAILELLDRTNLFLVPLDSERRWYRYHHLFAELLRQRLQQSTAVSAINALHMRASDWYEASGLELEAFHHAAAAHDIPRALRLIEGEGRPLHYRGASVPVLDWLGNLPPETLDAHPSLWVTYVQVLLFTGQRPAAEEKLKAAEAALGRVTAVGQDAKGDDLRGQIAALRANIATGQNDLPAIVEHTRHALQYLSQDNLPERVGALWNLGFAYQRQRNWAEASNVFNEILAMSRSVGDTIYTIAAATSLGQIHEEALELTQAENCYRQVLKMAGNPPQPVACEAHLGLARLEYARNRLSAAREYAVLSRQLTEQLGQVETVIAHGLFMTRLARAEGDESGAVQALDQAEAYAQQRQMTFYLPDIARARVRLLLQRGELAAARWLAEPHPVSRVRVALAAGEAETAHSALKAARAKADTAQMRLTLLCLEARMLAAQGQADRAVVLLGEALRTAEPLGMVRTFVDEGAPMAALLQTAVEQGIAPLFAQQVLGAFGATAVPPPPARQRLVDPLSDRELEVLQLLTTELSGPQIARQLMISLNTLRTHTKNIYAKLGANSRRTAVARAAELNLL